MIGITGTLSKAWMHRALGVVFNRDYYFDPVRRHEVDCLCNEYAAEMFPGMGLFYSESNLGRLQYWDKGQVQIGGIQPNMILAMLLGADFVPADDRDADITPGCLAGTDPHELPAPETLLRRDFIRLFDDQISQMRREGRLRPIPPFFWDASGRATIHGVLTSAQKLYGEGIFLDLMTEPRKCLKIVGWIAETYIVLCRHFAQAADLPITDIHVGECSGCMINPAMMDQFVVPATSRIARELGPVRFHSCGPSTHLLKTIAGIDRLGSLDLGGETSIRRAREIFGQEMSISIAPLPRDMSVESTTPILNWAGRVLEENAGGNLTFVYHLEPGYNLEAIRALTEFLGR
ncbi:MAG: hypothetical protein JW955_07190 [Sedimentisphaerales bacterium]|nr:hypothetical protein [Sedimentisphaerales bacterium]